MATPNSTALNSWYKHGVIGVPPAGDHQLSDVGRALRLQSGWYVPIGVRGPPGSGGGIHWYHVDSDGGNMALGLTHTGW